MATITNPWDPAQPTPTTNITPGLINSVPGAAPSPVPGTVTNADNTTFNALGTPPKQDTYGYTPSSRTVDPAKETVMGQFNALTQSDSPLIQAARTNSDQQMNRRGLLNSSMAIGASDQAAYAAALPIAQADAAVYNNTADRNLAYSNEALKFDTAAQNDAAKANQSAWLDAAKANLDSAMKTQLATIESDYKQVMQSSASASEMYKQMVKNVSDIALNKDMGATAKQQATNNQIQLFKDGMAITSKIGSLDLGTLLNFSAPTQT